MKLGVVTAALAPARSPEALQPELLFAAAHRLGLRALELPGRGWTEDGFVERVGALQARYGIEAHVGFGDDYVTHGADQPAERFAEFVERVCQPLGMKIIGTVSPFHGGRWRRDPPLAVQLERLGAALGRLAPIAEAGGVYLALENHADYRGDELAAVIRQVGSPAVGARFDTANPYAVIEEPVMAAAALAPMTLSTHIKDMVVEAEPGNRGLSGGLLALRACALGEGHVDLPAIVALLAEQSPLKNELVLTIETRPDFLEASVQYARRVFVSYLEE
jgi:sugar phosphate isomerase/epimerase